MRAAFVSNPQAIAAYAKDMTLCERTAPTLNLGILAHVDAGKTSLTERLLYAAGVIGEIGSVDDGSTQTDSLALERRRGITIKSAVVSFAIGDVTVNLIDTPGHPDFIAEVERVLSVLDGAVLVISAVESVQAQTRVLMRALQRLRIPTLIFVNKIDRGGADGRPRPAGHRGPADPGDRRDGVRGTAGHAGPRSSCPTARRTPFPGPAGRTAGRARRRHPGRVPRRTRPRCPPAAAPPRWRRRPGGRWCTRCSSGRRSPGRARPHCPRGSPVCCRRAAGDADGPGLRHRVQGRPRPTGEKIAYARLFSGTVSVRDRLRFGPAGTGAASTGPGHCAASTGKVTAISVFDRVAATARRRSAPARSGSSGAWAISRSATASVRRWCRGPAGSARTSRRRPWKPSSCPAARPTRVRSAPRSAWLAEQDPLINLRQDDIRQEILVSLYGEVQKEVIQATLATDFGLTSAFANRPRICIERLSGCGAAAEIIERRGQPVPGHGGPADRARSRWAAGSRSGWGRARLAAVRLQRPSRTPCGRPCARGCPAGRSPTPWSR